MNKFIEQLTSVAVNTEHYNEFKKKSVGTLTNLKQLVDFSMKLYMVDEKFRERVNNHIPGGNVSANKE